MSVGLVIQSPCYSQFQGEREKLLADCMHNVGEGGM